MLKFIRNLIRPGEKKPLAIRFDELPAWLENRRLEAESLFDQATTTDRGEIRAAAEQLSRVIGILLAAQFNEEIHPTLKSIAQKSLPLYTKAIEAALEKPLPEEPGQFYDAAAELLKACINSANAQGKYLRTVFPDEMKAVSACVATIGRSVNAMNGPLGAYRAGAGSISEAVRIHAALSDIGEDIAKSREKEKRMAGRIRELNERIAGCERTLADLEHKRSVKELAGREQEIALLTGERDQTVRRYAALSMTAAHVLRKAEKVARRQQKPLDERAIQRAIALLSHHTVPDSEELVSALAAAYLPAKQMIDAGELALKNKEERSLFSSPEGFSSEVQTLCTAFSRQAAACEAAEREFSSHPVIARHADLTRERKQLFDTLAKEKQACRELVHWRDELAKKVPLLREQLLKMVGGISGSDVQIHYPDDAPRSP